MVSSIIVIGMPTIAFKINHSAKAINHKCIGYCTFKLSLSEPFKLDSVCLNRTQSDSCTVEIDIDYNTKVVDVKFLTDDTKQQRANDDDYNIDQTIRMDFNTKVIKIKVYYLCYTDDECDLTYAKLTVDRLRSLNYQPAFDDFLKILHKPDNPVTQCYNNDNTVECVDGNCLALISNYSNEFDSKYCDQNGDPTETDLVIGEFRAFNKMTTLRQNKRIRYLCDTNLCNGKEFIDAVQKVVGNYDSTLSITSPYSGSATKYPYKLTTYTMILYVFCLIFY
ncbi:unnamed protein product [Didymodactylos carnosus]|uniref:Uncharacterized protein n=1 Tax=Didymodactylos carnosus TaxID=1234261 RepID=A0A814HDP9_9BILA|nr:unnamed protein product [Didymodactylos carnosus]CAF1007694.1 unnamed protein product [Didymodactylos carnosus]CAF3588324.1 unnamed protein product [Didymodactylos carnosus]CAF3778906.1 unnamed protein product [Didymodactylos carnosus]